MKSPVESDVRSELKPPEDGSTHSKPSAEIEPSVDVQTAEKPPLPRDTAADKEKQKRIEMAKYGLHFIQLDFLSIEQWTNSPT